MGDYYGQWQQYLSDNFPATFDTQSVTALFQKWAAINAPSKMGCVSALTRAMTDPLVVATGLFNSVPAGGTYAWNKTVDKLKAALAGGASKSFTMNSLTQSTDVKHTWAGGSTSVFFDLFSFGGGGGYDNLSAKATSAGVNITASFAKVTTFAAGPYAQKDLNDPILAKDSPWYDSAILALAYTTKDNTVWSNQSSITWDKAFGSAGFLQRMATALVVADGIEITMTSTATYSSSEQEQIKAAAKVGLWPFFSVSGGGGSTTTVTFSDSGTFTSKTSIPLGNPQMLGIVQSSMASIF
jgi:hypothetical protein